MNSLLRRHVAATDRAAVVAILMLIVPGTVLGQAPTDLEVLDVLRREVGARDSDTLRVSRTYSATFFPTTTFYRTVFHQPGVWDVPSARAAVAVTGSHTVPVSDFADAALVWKTAIVEKPLSAVEVELACSDLILHLGLISQRARFIESSSEIPVSHRKALKPQRALRTVAAATHQSREDGESAAFYVWSHDVLRVKCLAAGRDVRITVDTLARAPRNEP